MPVVARQSNDAVAKDGYLLQQYAPPSDPVADFADRFVTVKVAHLGSDQGDTGEACNVKLVAVLAATEILYLLVSKDVPALTG